MNWYKTSQDWYTEEIAKTTKNPQILIDILKRGNGDWVSQYAVLNPNCPPEALAEVLKREKDNIVSQDAAKHPNCPPEALAEVLKRGKNDWVSYYAAENHNCSPEILVEVLKRGKNDYVSRCAAKNPNCPPEALAEVLKRGNEDWVSQVAAYNKNCPPQILIYILKRGKDDLVSRCAARNPNCPKEMLKEILRRGKDDYVTQNAVENPNCPPEAIIQWMQLTGKIEKEDESKGHIIEYENKKQDDLSDLKKLLGSNFNLKKYAQDWYTEEIAKTTKNPQILIDILKRGNDDWVSYCAARNPNCPPEILAEVLKRGNNNLVSYSAAWNPNCSPETLAEVLKRGNSDSVSYSAAENHNCPPEILAEVLKRGKNDSVSQCASINPNCPLEALAEVLKRGKDDLVSRIVAKNPNCPPESLAEVLKRGNNDLVSRFAAKNPNCPPEARINWMQLTGKIEKEDESKGHIIEYENKKQDDLSDLKKLLGSNFNLKKHAQYWYTEQLARTTMNPQILIDILKRGNEDDVSYFAVKNPNCPPEALAEVLKRGTDDYVSQYAAKNLNCSKEMLVEILKRGKDDWVSYYAAENHNCPPEALAEVLKRGKNDYVSSNATRNPNCPSEALAEVLKRENDDLVSQIAVEHPNCPPEAKIKWMQLTGKIEKEDESKGHIIEYEDKKQDDLSDLKKLISKNIKLNKYSQDVDYPNIDRIKELAKKIDLAYKNKEFDNIEEMEQELEALIERTSDIQEEKLVEGGGETEGYDIEGDGFDKIESASLEELLAYGYLEYINFDSKKCGGFGSKKDIINNMRHNIIYYSGFSLPKKNITDKEILDAAKDAYERKINLINKHKKYKKTNKSNTIEMSMESSAKTFNLKKYAEIYELHPSQLQDLAKETKDIETLRRLFKKNDYDINVRIASNPNCPPDILIKILNDRSSDGYELYYSAVSNPNCPSEILTEILRKGNDDKISSFAVQNLNCPPEMLTEILRRKKDNSWVSSFAAKNPNCPPETLTEVLERSYSSNESGVGYAYWSAAENPNCPPETLANVLRRGNNDYLSGLVCENPNCPPEARIKWLYITGKIEKEDPTKHIIEYEDVNKDDLSDLKKILNNKEI